jgi:hypothetical protein
MVQPAITSAATEVLAGLVERVTFHNEVAWSSHYDGQPHPFVCVQTPQPMPAPGAALIADFWISGMS